MVSLSDSAEDGVGKLCGLSDFSISPRIHTHSDNWIVEAHRLYAKLSNQSDFRMVRIVPMNKAAQKTNNK
jgi:hypothetical protein